jgi:ribosomal protein L37E
VSSRRPSFLSHFLIFGTGVYRANCAECNANWNSSAFKSNKIGSPLPPADKRVLGFVHESDINNQICPRCDKKNYKLLKQRSAASGANDVPRRRANQGTKRARDFASKDIQKQSRTRPVDGLASLCAVVQEELDNAVEGKVEILFVCCCCFCLQYFPFCRQI